jgi:hypothetical protein
MLPLSAAPNRCFRWPDRLLYAGLGLAVLTILSGVALLTLFIVPYCLYLSWMAYVYSRTDTLKHWHSLKKAAKDAYRHRFVELLNRQGEFESSIVQEFAFAYKDATALLATQPHLLRCDETQPIVTVKFMGI